MDAVVQKNKIKKGKKKKVKKRRKKEKRKKRDSIRVHLCGAFSAKHGNDFNGKLILVEK